MGEAAVDVKIKAEDDGVKPALEGIREALDGLKEHAEGLGDLFKEAAEAFGLAFSIDKLKEFIEGMAQLGEQTERTANIFSISTEEVGLLKFAAEATGGSSEQLIRSLTRMSTALVDVSGKATPTGAAVKALGLDLKELGQLPLPELLDKLRERFSQLPPGLERTAIAQNLVRNGAESLLPILSMSTEKWEELRAGYEATGAALSGKTAEGFAETEHRLTLMSAAFLGLGERIFSVIKPAVDAAAEAVTRFVESIDAAHVAAALETLVDTLQTVMLKIVQIALEADRIIESIVIHVNSISENGLKAFDTAHVAKMDQQLQFMNARVDAQLKASESMFASWSKTIKGFITDATSGGARGGDTNERGIPKPTGFKPLDLGGNGGADEAAAAARSKMDAEIGVLQAGLERKKLLLQGDLAAGKINAQQFAQASIDATNAEYQAQVQVLQKEMEINGLKLSQRQEVMNKIKLLEQTNANEILKIQQKGAQDARKAWEAPINALGEAFNAQVAGLVNGTSTWTDALLGLGSQVASELIGQAIKSITALAAQAFAGVFAHDAPTLGLGAAGSAAAASASVAAAGAGLASLDRGTWGLPADGPIMAHKDEAVIPRFESGLFRDAMANLANGGGQESAAEGDTHVHFHGPVYDAKALANTVRDMWNKNPSLRPSF